MKKHKIIPFFIPHEGCINQCVFCDQHKVSGALNSPTSEYVEKRISDWVESSPESSWEVAFFGGSFTALPKEKIEYLLRPAKKAFKEKKISAIRVSTIPDAIDKDVLELLKKHNVRTVELGIQSTSKNVLLKSGRKYCDPREAAEALKKEGFSFGIQVMPGLPGDTLQTMEKTIKDLMPLGADIARIYPTLVIKGTPLYDMYLSNGFTPLSLEKAVQVSLWMKGKLESVGTHVIRVGLKLDNPLDSVAAGPYHPAFHTLVKSLLFKKMAVFLLEQVPLPKAALVVSPKSMDSLVGYKKENIFFLTKKYGHINIKENADSAPTELSFYDAKLKHLSINQERITSNESLVDFCSN